MKAKFIKTGGSALTATVEIEGKIYHAMDEVSSRDKPVEPGSVYDVEFTALCLGDEEWEDIFSGNPHKKKELVRKGCWSYQAYGEIVQVAPVIIDCGIEIEVPVSTHDERCIGEFISIEISRLDMTEKM